MGFIIDLLQKPDSALLKFIFSIIEQSFFLTNCVLMMRGIFKTQTKSKKQLLAVIPIIIAIALIHIWPSENKYINVAALILKYSIPFAESRILLRKPPVLKLIATVLTYGIIRDILSATLSHFWGKEQEDLIDLCLNPAFFIVILLFYLVYYNKRNPAEKLSYLNPFTFIWASVTVIFFGVTFIDLMGDSEFQHQGLIVADIVILIAFIPYIINAMLSAKQSEAYFRRALDAEIRQFEIIGEKDEDLRRFRHDYANHMRAISAMIEDGQTDDVKDYVAKLGVDLQSTTRDFYTGNYMLDIILAEKRSVARQDGNDIVFEGSFPKSGIKNDDICTIMANALDNAVEACSGIKERCEIVVKSIAKEDQVVVSITNPIAVKARIIAGSVATSKSDKNRHGYGLKSIKKAVEQYDGYMHLRSDHKTFELFFSLKLRQEISPSLTANHESQSAL